MPYPHGFFYCLISSFTIVLPNRKFLDVKHTDPFYCCINQESLLFHPHGSSYCLTSSFTIVLPKRKFSDVEHMDPFLLSLTIVLPKRKFLDCEAHGPLLLLNKLGNLYCTTHMLSSIVLQITPVHASFHMLLPFLFTPSIVFTI